MTKQLFIAAVAFSAFTACSDSNFVESELGMIEPETDITMNSAVLTDVNGQQVSSVSAKFGTYYLDIKTDGIWYIDTDNYMEFSPSRYYGRGSMRVPVKIGTNWATGRQLTYSVNFIDEEGRPVQSTTRADGDNTQTVTQEPASATDLEAFKKMVNSNIYVGYGYNPTKGGANPALWTGIEVFKMDDLNSNTNLVKSSLVPQTEEAYIFSHSEEALDKIIGVSVSPSGNFGAVKFDTAGVTVNTTNINHTGHTAMQKRLTRTIYSRELAFAEATTDANAKFDESNFSNGFKRYKNEFIANLKAAGNDEKAKRAVADEFFNVVGTHVVTKALLGQELNYRIVVDSSVTKKSTEVKVALDFKWQQQIKDTTKADSATKARIKALEEEWKKDSTKRKSFALNTGVEVTDAAYKAASSTNAKVKARGGDVELVSILATGGSLVNEDVKTWLLTTQPEKAAMVGVESQPIYVLFRHGDTDPVDEKNAYTYLKNLIDTYLKVDPKMYGTIKDSDVKVD